MKKPKVAIITSFPRAQRIHVYNEMARLDEVNFRVFYLREKIYGRYWTYGPSIEHDAVFIPEIRLRPHLYLSPGLLRAYRAYSPDLMIMTQYASPGMQLVMYHDSILNRPWVFWAEIPYVRYAENPIVSNNKLRAILRNFAMLPIKHWPCEVWGIGKNAVAEYRQLVDQNISVKNLPYYADLNRFFSAGEQRSHAPHVRFLFSGSLSLRKGADILAEAIQILTGQGHNFEVHIAGKGPLQSCFEFLSDKAKEKIKLYGFVQLNEIPTIYADADVLLFPSLHDGWGMTLPEGMAAGMPVISTAQTGSAVDMIIHGENGYLMESLNTDQLVFYMRTFIEKPAIIRTMGEKARETAANYTHRVGARVFLDMIHNVI
jgi:glycosyltransferase involved in cell wall biosynthesis